MKDKELTESDNDLAIINNTKREFNRQFYEQEHRLIPAVFNFFSILFSASKEDRQYYFPSVAKALFWCLLPSTGTASVGILAILTLLVAVHQSSLLQSQNNKIEVQNILAEAERRSTLMFETVAIFEQIELEKNAVSNITTPKEQLCQEDMPVGPCWLAQKGSEMQKRPLDVVQLFCTPQLSNFFHRHHLSFILGRALVPQV